jgi:hypothetical protein
MAQMFANGCVGDRAIGAGAEPVTMDMAGGEGVAATWTRTIKIACE